MTPRLIVLLLLPVVSWAADANRPTGRESASAEHLIKLVRGQGDAGAMQEMFNRRNPEFKTFLEEIATSFTGPGGDDWRKLEDLNDRHTMQLIERSVRTQAKVLLVRWGEEKYLDELGAELSSPDPAVRHNSLAALKRIGNKVAVKYLIKHIDDDSVWKPASDINKGPFSVSVMAALAELTHPLEMTRSLKERKKIVGHVPEDARPYWKQWWQKNKSRYEKMTLQEGW